MSKLNKRQIAKAATRDKAIRAANTLWSLPGSYADHGIREIAAHMGMSTGAVFANFETKDDLWRATFDCAPPVDSILTRSAPAMFKALQGLIDIRPEVAHEIRSGSPTAWQEAEAIIERIKDLQLQDEARFNGNDEVQPMEMAA